MYLPLERRTVAQALPLTNGAINRFSNIFPLDGTGWTLLRLTFHATHTTAITTPAIVNGGYRWLKGISFKTSRGEVICDNVPGQALRVYQALNRGKLPFQDRLLIATLSVTDFVVEIPFCQDYLNRPEDTIFNSGMYSNAQLDIATGTFLDFGAAGVSAVAVTMDIEVENTLSALSKDGKSGPIGHFYIRSYGPIDQTVATNLYDLESSLDLGLFGFALKTCTNGLMPCAWDGISTDLLTTLTFRDSVRRWVDNALPISLRQNVLNRCDHDNNLLKYCSADNVDTFDPVKTLAGIYYHSFISNGSINEHYPTGKKSLIRVDYTTTNANDETSLLVWGFRALR